MVKETTIYDFKARFSEYANDLLSGTYESIVVKKRSVPILEVKAFEQQKRGITLGVLKDKGFSDIDFDAFMGLDNEIEAMFEGN